MDIVKKNLLSIICGVVALLAVVFYFWPLGSMQAQQQKALEERIGVHKKMQTVLNAPRTLPPTDIAGGGEGQKLEGFPTQPVIEWGENLKKQILEQSSGIEKVARDVNERKPLVANALPEPARMADFAFRDQYGPAVTRLYQMLRAGTPPTQEEISEALGQLSGNARSTLESPAMAGGMDEASKEQQQQIRALAVGKALRMAIYADPEALQRSSQVLPSGKAPSAVAIWYAQVGLWLQTDVVQAIVETNKSAQNVISAPIKSLEEIKLAGYRTEKGLVTESTAVPQAGAAPAGSGMMAPPPPGTAGSYGMMMPPPPGMGGFPAQGVDSSASSGPFGTSPTGRVCNSLFDVFAFELVIRVETDQLPRFIQELSRNRFVTVYKVDVRAVDSAVAQAVENVVYGSKPVVEATLQGEALMLRNWTLPLMPEEVKQQLGVGVSPAQ